MKRTRCAHLTRSVGVSGVRGRRRSAGGVGGGVREVSKSQELRRDVHTAREGRHDLQLRLQLHQLPRREQRRGHRRSGGGALGRRGEAPEKRLARSRVVSRQRRRGHRLGSGAQRRGGTRRVRHGGRSGERLGRPLLRRLPARDLLAPAKNGRHAREGPGRGHDTPRRRARAGDASASALPLQRGRDAPPPAAQRSGARARAPAHRPLFRYSRGGRTRRQPAAGPPQKHIPTASAAHHVRSPAPQRAARYSPAMRRSSRSARMPRTVQDIERQAQREGAGHQHRLRARRRKRTRTNGHAKAKLVVLLGVVDLG